MNAPLTMTENMQEHKFDVRSLSSADVAPKRLSPQQYKELGEELDQLRQQIADDLGQSDVDYINQVIRVSRGCEVVGRLLLHVSLDPVTWSLGVASLSAAKILENMEIGHNVMHGQYDWTNDKALSSRHYDWDNVCDKESWRNHHNFEHHTYTNIIGKDRDYGYAVLRLSDDEPWRPRHLLQPAAFVGLTLLFEWGVALHEIESEKLISGEISIREKIPFLKRFAKKASRQVIKDYVFFPMLAGPMAGKVALGNLAANGIRNIWTGSVIFCGHFTEGAETFTEEECENETKGQWYFRQILGSSNFEGPRWLHILSGHLSHQMEHHLFPDIPAHRYTEMQTEVKRICEKFSIPYNTGSFKEQYKTVLQRVWKYTLPTAA
ncbi:MAG: acyl-CoA desaturase [Moraxellaceae bacterium]|nr:MAG: acyl-CoA desaturase [Moraxellaceae bacterium]